MKPMKWLSQFLAGCGLGDGLVSNPLAYTQLFHLNE